FEALVGFVLASPDAESMRRQPGSAVFLENLENFFPVAEGVEQGCDGADVECVSTQPEHVTGQPVQLGQNYPDVSCTRWCFDIEQFLYRFAIPQTVRNRGDVIHAVDVGIEHRIGAVFGNLLHSAMEVSDDALSPKNLLTIQL